MKSKDLIYIEDRDMVFCPFCQEEVEELIVTVEGWGKMDLSNRSVNEVEVTEIKEYECPHCGREVDYE